MSLYPGAAVAAAAEGMAAVFDIELHDADDVGQREDSEDDVIEIGEVMRTCARLSTSGRCRARATSIFFPHVRSLSLILDCDFSIYTHLALALSPLLLLLSIAIKRPPFQSHALHACVLREREDDD